MCHMSDVVLREGVRLSPAGTRNFTNVAGRLPVIQKRLDRREFRFPPKSERDLHSSVMLRGLDW